VPSFVVHERQIGTAEARAINECDRSGDRPSLWAIGLLVACIGFASPVAFLVGTQPTRPDGILPI